VFVEKPLCLTEEELIEIAAAYGKAAANGVRLMVGFNRRFSPHAREMQTFFAGRSDPLVMVYRVNAGAIPGTHWIQDNLAGGGRILGEACHFIDYMQAISGAAPVSVHGRRIRQHSSGIVDDQSILSFGFADGSIGTVVYAAGGSTVLSKERCEAFGDGKSVTMDDFMVSEFYARGRVRRFKTAKREKGFPEEMACFVRMVLGAEQDTMPFEGIASVTRATLLAARSLQTGHVYAV
jgi:predicted dehydrogenase